MEWKRKPSSSTLRGQSTRGTRSSRCMALAGRRAAGGAEAAARDARRGVARSRADRARGRRRGARPGAAAAAGVVAVVRPVEEAPARMALLGGGRAVLGLVAPVGEAVLARGIDVAAPVVLAAAREAREPDEHQRDASGLLHSPPAVPAFGRG